MYIEQYTNTKRVINTYLDDKCCNYKLALWPSAAAAAAAPADSQSQSMKSHSETPVFTPALCKHTAFCKQLP